jgi:hypothetical protein
MSDNVEIGSPCTRDVNGPGETDRANGGWPQRLVRRFCHWILVKKSGE